jgi:triosephosphate isomerase
MNLSRVEAVGLASSLSEVVETAPTVDVAVFPPFPWIVPVGDELRQSGVAIGAQHCHHERSGAFTGEVSAAMLADVCDVILAGHSERRHLFGESDDLVGSKVAAILATTADPVLCVGETIAQRESGEAQGVVARQLAAGLTSIGEASYQRVTIAYEPVWAIGTGVAATPDDAQAMSAFVRSWLFERFGDDGRSIRVLYGGSVTPANAATLFDMDDIDGALVGGASLTSESFLAIVRAAASVMTM